MQLFINCKRLIIFTSSMILILYVDADVDKCSLLYKKKFFTFLADENPFKSLKMSKHNIFAHLYTYAENFCRSMNLS